MALFAQIGLLILLSGFHLLFTFKTNAYFSLDDFAVLNYLQTHSWSQMITQFLTQGDIWGFKKILGYLNFSLLFNIFGANPTAFIINNYLLHTANIILVFLISLRLTKDSLKAFFVSVIANSLYLTYFSNIHEYLVVLFILSSALLYLHSRFKLSLVVFVLALLTKEIAFTLPFFLLAINHHQKLKESNLQFFIVLAIYVLYQLFVGPSKIGLPLNHSYATSFSLSLIINNLKFYLPLWLVALSLLFTSPILLVSLLSLFPSLLLLNRQEIYYLYLPLVYYSIFLATRLPKFNLKTSPVYLLIFFLLGGRKILPPIPKQNYPNWQKVSIQNVVDRVENNILSEDIDVSDIHLERDTKLMLGSNTLNLFVNKELSLEYNFVYNPDTQTIKINKQHPSFW
jgi:hypothetical protein